MWLSKQTKFQRYSLSQVKKLLFKIDNNFRQIISGLLYFRFWSIPESSLDMLSDSIIKLGCICNAAESQFISNAFWF